MHTYIQHIHKHLVLASLATLLLATLAWVVDGYANPSMTSASSLVDVSISATPYPTVVASGDSAGFLLYYKTRGGGSAQGIQVSATLPATMTVVSSFPSNYTQQGNTYTWTNLPDNYGPVVVEVRVQGAQGTSHNIQATVTTTSNDTNLVNNSTQSSITIVNTQESELYSDMEVSVAATEDTFSPGATIPYTIQYKNNGPDTADEAVVVMTIPSELTYVTGSVALDPISTDSTLVWKIDDLTDQSQGQIQLQLLLSNVVESSETIFSYVTISAANNDIEPLTNQSHTSILVVGSQQQSPTPSNPTQPTAPAGGAGGGAEQANPTTPVEQDTQPTVSDAAAQQETELPASSGFLFTLQDDEALIVPSSNTCASMQELQAAYTFAYNNDITTMATLAQARMCDGVIRSELAKMISNYAINVLGKTPDTSIECAFNDMAAQPQDLQNAAITACQLGLMGLDSDGKPVASFNPTQTVTRAIFGTAFSRLLYGDIHNTGGSTWYDAHLTALFADDIIKNTTPTLQELRGYIMIMMQRSEK